MNKPRRASEAGRRNSANWLCNFGRRSAPLGDIYYSAEASLKRGERLFPKNTGLCKLVRGSIGTDTCPVPEGEGKGCKL